MFTHINNEYHFLSAFRGACFFARKKKSWDDGHQTIQTIPVDQRHGAVWVAPLISPPETDSTIPLPRTSIFFSTNVSWVIGTNEEGFCWKKIVSIYFLVCKGLSLYRTMTCRGGKEGAPYFRRYVRELALKPAISLKKSWGGYRRTTPESQATSQKKGFKMCSTVFFFLLARSG